MLGISPENLYLILKYLYFLHDHLQEHAVMLVKPKSVDEACVQA